MTIQSLTDWAADQFQCVHMGNMIWQKFGAAIQLLILVGVYDSPMWAKIAVAPVALFLLWVVGYWANETGFKDRFTARQQKAIIDGVIDELQKNGSIKVEREQRDFVITRLAKVVLTDLSTEDQIDREAKRRLRSMPSAPPEGSAEWELLFRREKEQLAARKGYVL